MLPADESARVLARYIANGGDARREEACPALRVYELGVDVAIAVAGIVSGGNGTVCSVGYEPYLLDDTGRRAKDRPACAPLNRTEGVHPLSDDTIEEVSLFVACGLPADHGPARVVGGNLEQPRRQA